MELKRRHRISLQDGAFVLLLLAVAGLAGYLAWSERREWDLTQNARNTLSPQAAEIVRQIHGPVTITAYATATPDAQLGDLRSRTQEFVARYQKVKPDIVLNFVDPEAEPDQARRAGVRENGDLIVAYGKRFERLSPFELNEQDFTTRLERLVRGAGSLVMYLTGHGERSLQGIANYDLGEFGKRLAAAGFKLAPLNLAQAQAVPDNATLLVIAGPRVDLLPGEVNKIINYVDRGGSLLWLVDPGPLHGLTPLADKLGLELSPGVIVDPAARELKAPVTWALASSYGHHPSLKGFNLVTVFPVARPIGASENKTWHGTPLVEVAQRGWVTTGKLGGKLSFDKGRDVPGPVTVATALDRTLDNDQEQRIVVVGSGSFLANAFVGNGGNLDLGLNLVNWLTGEKAPAGIQPRRVLDASLNLTRTSALAITVGFLILLPFAFLTAASALWWRRRKL